VKRPSRILALAATIVAAALVTVAPASARTQRATTGCGAGANGSAGYAYAGHQGDSKAFGVKATITQITTPSVAAGHVAGWVGVGGPGQGPNGVTEWIQTGLATMPDTGTQIYAEITTPGQEPEYHLLLDNVQVGEAHEVAVLEVAGKTDTWRVWLDGKPATDPMVLPGSHKRWEPIVTAESYNDQQRNDQQPLCNTFGFRFDKVDIATSQGGAWKPFHPGYDFLDQGLSVRQVRSTTTTRQLAADTAYAFEAVSGA
jgi:hypothetical protein